jgi:hypothetical protein
MSKTDVKAEWDRLLGTVKERQQELGLVFDVEPEEEIEAGIERVNQAWAALATFLLDELCRVTGQRVA